jgi:hypothetical protein
MARIVLLDDFEAYAQMAAGPLLAAGHDVHVDIVPIDWEAVFEFHPDVIIALCYRKESAQNLPIEDWEVDILGAAALKEIEAYPAAQLMPILITGDGLKASDVPTRVRYDAFLTLPSDFKRLLAMVDELFAMQKSRRIVSDYVCPKPGCGSRLTRLPAQTQDLFCPKCFTSVAIIEEEGCIARGRKGETIACSMAQLNSRPNWKGATPPLLPGGPGQS